MSEPHDGPAGGPAAPPPPLTVAASVAGVQGLVLVVLAVLEAASIEGDRLGLGASTAIFFGVYGVVLLAAAWGVHRCAGWARGPVLITQLICLGLAWNTRDEPLVAIALVICAAIVLAGMMHPDTVRAMDRLPPDAAGEGQSSDSRD